MSDELESRYRRLLAWYPWSHRRVYEEEMLAVLVAGAEPGQRRPTLGESANLIASGLGARLRAAVPGFANPSWVDAAAVFGLLAALVLVSQRIVRLFDPFGLAPELYLRAADWGAVVLAAAAGLRRVGAVLAWATVVGEAALLAGRYDTDPVSTIQTLWPFALGVVAAAALTVPAPPRRALAVLRAPRLVAFVAGVGLIHTMTVVNRHQRVSMFEDGGGVSYMWYGFESTSETVLYLMLAAVVVGAVAAALAAFTLPGPVWRRIALLLAPVAAIAAIVEYTLEGWAYSNMHMGHPIYLVPVQWTLLIAVPLAAFAAGSLLVHRLEHTARLAALGRTADRERLEPSQ
ncbi:hypothetical protein [Phytohabitans rumicis]|uniref:Uncharacterized protein n=1 Tax=Phytohabitans rumicis TaxID=1076125 RepID=A0A6V8LJK1_9ACTN|nr:hypothetical protein [Phytohabitans rumicis]GFJ95048.1 hypothetical protein Prum_086900 [Phytohabitans rumicis]